MTVHRWTDCTTIFNYDREREGNKVMESYMSSTLYTAAKAGDVDYLVSDTLWEEINVPLDTPFEGASERLRCHLLFLTVEENNCLHIAARFGHEEFGRRVLSLCPSLLYQQNKRKDNPLHVAARAGHLGVVKLLTDSFRRLQPPQSSQSTESGAGNRATTTGEEIASEGSSREAEEGETAFQSQEISTELADSALQPPQTSQSRQSIRNCSTAGDDVNNDERSLREAEEGKRPSCPTWSTTQNEQNGTTLNSIQTPQSSQSCENGVAAVEEIPPESSLPTEADQQEGIAIQNQENSIVVLTDSIQSPLREAYQEGEWPSLPIWRTQNHDDSTALHEALRRKHNEVALHLLGLENLGSADELVVLIVNAKDESPLYLAAEAGLDCVLTKIFEILQASGKINTIVGERHVNAVDDERHITVVGPNGQTPLHAAVFAESAESIEVLHRWIPELSKKRDSCGKTALYYATQANCLKIMRLLLKLDASSAYISDNEGLSPLLVAASVGLPSSVRAILDACPASIECCDDSHRNALHLAEINNIIPRFQELLKMPEMMSLINEPDKDGNTPLHLANMEHNFKRADALLSTKRVDITAKNNLGQTVMDACILDAPRLTYGGQRRIWRKLKRTKAPMGRVRPLMRFRLRGPSFIGKKRLDDMDEKQVINTLSVVAALLATITFAAAFTIPGGYKSDGPNAGSPLLMHKAALSVFLLSDTIALVCSMAALILLLNATINEKAFLQAAIYYGAALVLSALYAALITFISGLYVVTSIESCIIASSIYPLNKMVFYATVNEKSFSPGVVKGTDNETHTDQQVAGE